MADYIIERIDPELAALIEECDTFDAKLEKINAHPEEQRKKWWRSRFKLPDDASDEAVAMAINKHIEENVMNDFANMSPEEQAEWEQVFPILKTRPGDVAGTTGQGKEND